jgi:hypothetical protein
MDTSNRCIVVGSFVVPVLGAGWTAALFPDLVLNTFVDPCRVMKRVYTFLNHRPEDSKEIKPLERRT